MATYVPVATQATEPLASQTVESAALEFRTLKTSVNTRVTDEINARVAGDANLQTQVNTVVNTANTKAAESAASATAALASQNAAATSASTASTQATNSTTSATNSATSATASATSATNSSNSATGASGSATTATTQATNAAASYDAFDDRYLGSKATAPTLDNDGAALLVGALYWDTVTPEMRVWNGTAWLAVQSLSSATTATTQATNAANSATSASTSATSASNSATAAATSATNTEALYDSFDDRYLGAKTTAPTLDNDGAALLVGALYFNSTDSTLYSRSSGGTWVSSTATTAGAVSNTPAGNIAATNVQAALNELDAEKLSSAAGAVATASLADDAVTYAKLQNISATDRLLGRVTAGAGDAEEIVCTPFARTLLDDANQQAALVTLGTPLNATVALTAAYTVVAADRGKLFDCSGTFTITLTAAATLASGFSFAVQNSGTGVITLDPNLAELVDGVATITYSAGDSSLVTCNGTAFKTVGKRSAGRMVQNLNLTTGAVATGTTLIPKDDTIPQITEGDQYLSLAITPTNALSVLLVSFEVYTAVSVANNIVAALFRDAGANAVAATFETISVADHFRRIGLTYRVAAGATAATTFSVRIGPQTAATVTLNGQVAARVFGGVIPSRITIQEFLP